MQITRSSFSIQLNAGYSYDEMREFVKDLVNVNDDEQSSIEREEDYSAISDTELFVDVQDDSSENVKVSSIGNRVNNDRYEELKVALVKLEHRLDALQTHNDVKEEKPQRLYVIETHNESKYQVLDSYVDIIRKCCPRSTKICPICRKSVICVSRHVINVHFRIKRYSCDCNECEMKTFYQYDMNRHKNVHRRIANYRTKMTLPQISDSMREYYLEIIEEHYKRNFSE